MICLDVVPATRIENDLVRFLSRLAVEPKELIAFDRDPSSVLAAEQFPPEQNEALSHRQTAQITAFFSRENNGIPD